MDLLRIIGVGLLLALGGCAASSGSYENPAQNQVQGEDDTPFGRVNVTADQAQNPSLCKPGIHEEAQFGDKTSYGGGTEAGTYYGVDASLTCKGATHQIPGANPYGRGAQEVPAAPPAPAPKTADQPNWVEPPAAAESYPPIAPDQGFSDQAAESALSV